MNVCWLSYLRLNFQPMQRGVITRSCGTTFVRHCFFIRRVRPQILAGNGHQIQKRMPLHAYLLSVSSAVDGRP